MGDSRVGEGQGRRVREECRTQQSAHVSGVLTRPGWLSSSGQCLSGQPGSGLSAGRPSL